MTREFVIEIIKNFKVENEVVCPKCNGKGTIKENDRGFVWHDKCPVCKGKKTVIEISTLSFNKEVIPNS